MIGSRAEAARFHIALLADFKAVAAVARLGAHIPAALVADGKLGVVADALEGDIAHGGVEIRYIQAALCLGRQRVVFQGDHQAVALLLDVGLAGKGGGIEFDDARIAVAAAEINIGTGNGLLGAGAGRGRCNRLVAQRAAADALGCCDGLRLLGRFAHIHPHFIALDLGVVLAGFAQGQQNAGAVVVLCGGNLPQQRVGIFQHRLRQLNAGAREIERNAGGCGGDKAAGRHHIFIKLDFDDFLVVRQRRHINIGNVAGKSGRHGQAQA